MTDHNLLIEKLSAQARPVARPWPAGWRALAWIALALPCGAAASLLLHRSLTDWSQPGAAWAILQLALTFCAGALAIHTAFQMSIAGRRTPGWQHFAVLIACWAASVAINLHAAVLPVTHGEGTSCYTFMLVVSVPMVALVTGFLRRTRTLYPVRSLATAGAGVACMALTLLSLCHPFHLHTADLLMHIAAAVTIIAATVLCGRKWVSLP